MNRIVDIVIPVYNDNPYLKKTLTSVFSQKLPKDWAFHIYVVDDGSDVPISLDIPKENTSNVSLIRLESNQGCSVARNRGASKGVGEVILFLDADCSLMHDEVLALLLKQYMRGFDACFGQITVSDESFWGRYQNDVAEERAIRFKQGELFSMTTQVVMVARVMFIKAGGFDEAYHFGFEDRDLFISLIKTGAKFSLDEEALVHHNDQLSLISVTKKLYDAGKTPSTRFIEKHPDYYAKMSYVKADVRYSSAWLKLGMLFLTKPILWPLIGVIDWSINNELLPYFLTKNLVKYASGLSYLHGSYAATRLQC